MSLNFRLNHIADALPWIVAKHLKGWAPPESGYYFIFNENPLIVLIPEDTYDDEARWRPFFEALGKTKVNFLCMIRGAVEADSPGYQRQISAFVHQHRQRFPVHTLTFLANDEAQVAIFEAAQLPYLFVNQNAYADENTFRILPEQAKSFDAIYNAFCAGFKRLHLAQAVKNLALITYIRGAESTQYFQEHVRLLAGAEWLNFPDHQLTAEHYRPLAPTELCDWLNRSRCGLCLSEREGSMFASVEYLLSGVPIVTTPSIGGRDVFYHDDYVLTVQPDTQSVAAGVIEMNVRHIDPHHIRAQTLKTMAVHRKRLIDFLVTCAGKQGVHLGHDETHSRIFSQTIYRPRPLHTALKLR